MMRNRAALLILLACIPALAGGEPKWSDEQRVNNCKVPEEKRGKTPRPDKCTRDIPGS